jgi:hypothetical protein
MGAALATQAHGQPATAPHYSPSGELLMPAGYETWVFVGSNLGLAYRQELPAMTPREASRADPPEFHNVYINKEAYERFRADGTFPEPTILVMERFAAADKEPRGVLRRASTMGNASGLRSRSKTVHVRGAESPGLTTIYRPLRSIQAGGLGAGKARPGLRKLSSSQCRKGQCLGPILSDPAETDQINK